MERPEELYGKYNTARPSMATGVTALIPLDGATPTSLSLPASLSYEEWAATLHAVARMGKAVQFWLGDALLYGENQYGELMAQAASETGYSSESLRGFLWVASRVPPSVRRLTLSWTHHQVAAGQDDPAQWLADAEYNQWTVKEMREAVKPSKPKAICGYELCPMRTEVE
jgi:hypothetical protein